MAEVASVRIENTPKVETSKYRPGAKGFFDRVKNFVGITTKVEDAVQNKPKEEIDKVSGMGFFERVGLSMDNGVANLKEKATKAWGTLKEKFNSSKEYFENKGKEIQDRREKLGIVDTIKSYVKDGVDGVRSRIDVVEAKWKDAEVKQLVGERASLRASYEEAKQMKAEGKEVPEGYIVSRNQLREALRPIRAAELAARRERRELRQESKVLRRKIETKQNAKEIFAKAKEKSRATAAAPKVAAAAI